MSRDKSNHILKCQFRAQIIIFMAKNMNLKPLKPQIVFEIKEKLFENICVSFVVFTPIMEIKYVWRFVKKRTFSLYKYIWNEILKIFVEDFGVE